jgi:hypothetical protein
MKNARMRMMIYAIAGMLAWFMGLTSLRASEPAPFAVTVVPTGSSLENGKGIEQDITHPGRKPDKFFVILTNVSKDAQSVFQHWNSWGDRSISFHFTTPDGVRHSITRQPGDYTRNVPGTFLLLPGEQQVYVIELGQEWVTEPKYEKGPTSIDLVAIYRLDPSPEAKKYKVWTGEVASKSYKFFLFRY